MDGPTETTGGAPASKRGRSPGSRSTQFKRGQRKGPVGKDARSSSPPIPQRLKDMRHVYSKAEVLDRTQGQRFQRKLMNDQPATFQAQMTKLEEAYREELAAARAAADAGKRVVELPRGEREQRLVGVIEGLLEGWSG